MKRFAKSMLGVTLLEIMLVLAIAAMIIVMSVRYYQSASSSQQANAIVQQIQAITASVDGLAQATGSYSNLTSAQILPLLPGGSSAGLTTPWGTTITMAFSGASSYSVTIPGTPSGVCPLVVSRLTANNHYTTSTTCSTSGSTSLTYTYTANP